MLCIDSQIWIYYFDTNALEHKNVSDWMNGKHEDGVLFIEEIILSTIIPMEVAHNLFKLAQENKDMDRDKTEEILLSMVSLENCQLVEVDQLLIITAIKKLKKYVSMGIGGRDSIILASMERLNMRNIATHDKNILFLKDLKRIDPTFSPPLILNIGEEFNYQDFKSRLSEK